MPGQVYLTSRGHARRNISHLRPLGQVYLTYLVRVEHGITAQNISQVAFNSRTQGVLKDILSNLWRAVARGARRVKQGMAIFGRWLEPPPVVGLARTWV